MSASDYSRKVSRDITRSLMQQYFNNVQKEQNSTYQYGKISADGNSATLPDGTTMDILNRGRPGQYSPIYKTGAGQGIADVEEQIFFTADGEGINPRLLVAGISADRIGPGQTSSVLSALITDSSSNIFTLSPSYLQNLSVYNSNSTEYLNVNCITALSLTKIVIAIYHTAWDFRTNSSDLNIPTIKYLVIDKYNLENGTVIPESTYEGVINPLNYTTPPVYGFFEHYDGNPSISTDPICLSPGEHAESFEIFSTTTGPFHIEGGTIKVRSFLLENSVDFVIYITQTVIDDTVTSATSWRMTVYDTFGRPTTYTTQVTGLPYPCEYIYVEEGTCSTGIIRSYIGINLGGFCQYVDPLPYVSVPFSSASAVAKVVSVIRNPFKESEVVYSDYVNYTQGFPERFLPEPIFNFGNIILFITDFAYPFHGTHYYSNGYSGQSLLQSNSSFPIFFYNNTEISRYSGEPNPYSPSILSKKVGISLELIDPINMFDITPLSLMSWNIDGSNYSLRKDYGTVDFLPYLSGSVKMSVAYTG